MGSHGPRECLLRRVCVLDQARIDEWTDGERASTGPPVLTSQPLLLYQIEPPSLSLSPWSTFLRSQTTTSSIGPTPTSSRPSSSSPRRLSTSTTPSPPQRHPRFFSTSPTRRCRPWWMRQLVHGRGTTCSDSLRRSTSWSCEFDGSLAPPGIGFPFLVPRPVGPPPMSRPPGGSTCTTQSADTTTPPPVPVPLPSPLSFSCARSVPGSCRSQHRHPPHVSRGQP